MKKITLLIALSFLFATPSIADSLKVCEYPSGSPALDTDYLLVSKNCAGTRSLSLLQVKTYMLSGLPSFGTMASEDADDYTNTSGLVSLLIEDSINNSEVSKSPTSNAVYDALALKANLVSPVFTTPSIGVATAISVNGLTITPSTGTLSVTNGKTLSAQKSMSFTAADDTGSYTFPTGTKTLLASDGNGSNLTGLPITYCYAGSDFNSTSLEADSAVVDEYPFSSTFTVTSVYAYVRTAPSGTLTIDINEGGTSILSTKLTIDSGEFNGGSSLSQGTAATAAVISDSSIAANARLTADIDSTTGGKGLVVCIAGHY